jgi:hypothetical protein
MIAILNKILADRLDTNAVMAKLDEILKGMNPNVAPKVYMCNGTWRSAGPGVADDGVPSVLMINTGGDTKPFKEMIQLNNSGDYAGLLNACLAAIKSTPEWLTPRLFCSIAYLETKDETNAREMLAEFDAKTGPYYTVGECRQMSDYLHANLGRPTTH